MTGEYHQAVASHYAAYRPPLHQPILTRALSGRPTFSAGLDVGCGTGRSAVALVEFCRRVFAVDPSQAMLDAAIPHDAIEHLLGCGEKTSLPEHSIDIITFAGSLSYADTDATVREVQRVGRPNALVVAYDFEIQLDDWTRRLGVAADLPKAHYNPCANFSGHAELIELLVEHDRVELDVSPDDLAHLLLANAARHEAFAARYGTADPFDQLADDVADSSDGVVLQADTYCSIYRLIEN